MNTDYCHTFKDFRSILKGYVSTRPGWTHLAFFAILGSLAGCLWDGSWDRTEGMTRRDGKVQPLVG